MPCRTARDIFKEKTFKPPPGAFTGCFPVPCFNEVKTAKDVNLRMRKIMGRILLFLGCLILTGCASGLKNAAGRSDLADIHAETAPNFYAKGLREDELHSILSERIPGCEPVKLPESAGVPSLVTGGWVAEGAFAFVVETPDMSCGAYLWNAGDNEAHALKAPRYEKDPSEAAVYPVVRGLTDGRIFIAMGDSARFFDAGTGHVVETAALPEHSLGAGTLDISPDGRRLAHISKTEKRVVVTSLPEKKAAKAFKNRVAGNSLALTPSSVCWVDGKTLLYTMESQDKSREVGLINADEGSRKVFEDWTLPLTPLFGGRFFYSSGADGLSPLAVGLYDPVRKKAESLLSGNETAPTQGFAALSGSAAAICYKTDKTVGLRVVSTASGAELARWEGLCSPGSSSGAQGIPLVSRAQPSPEGSGLMLITNRLSDGGVRLYYVRLKTGGER